MAPWWLKWDGMDSLSVGRPKHQITNSYNQDQVKIPLIHQSTGVDVELHWPFIRTNFRAIGTSTIRQDL